MRFGGAASDATDRGEKESGAEPRWLLSPSLFRLL